MQLLKYGLLLGALAMWTGCSSSTPTTPDQHAEEEHDHGHDHAHDHPTHGPHKGSLIELGNEAYHGELVHNDETGEVTIYLLDSAAKEPVTTSATEVTINVTQNGNGQQFTLPAVGGEAMSSQFASNDPALGKALDAEGAEAQLVVTIGDNQYRGQIEHHHDHDHDGHDHAGHDH